MKTKYTAKFPYLMKIDWSQLLIEILGELAVTQFCDKNGSGAHPTEHEVLKKLLGPQ